MRLSIIYLVFSFLIIYASESAFTGADDIGVTDSASMQLYSFFDLRDRDSFIQITNTANSNQVIHVQIFNVMDNCNENNFYDTYTGSDTYTYNLRNIITNDGNPAGVVLPGDAFGIVVATTVLGVGENSVINQVLIGNSRIIDILGYEYRSNLIGIQFDFFQPEAISTFNFSQQAGTALSDFVGIALHDTGPAFPEVSVSDALNVNIAINVDIYNNNEVVFSCRDVVFA